MGKWRKRYKQGQQQQSFNRLHRAVEVDHERLMHEAVEAERAKVEQLDFLQRMKALKTSILARTLFVDHVNVDELPAIRDFFQTNFGPVEDCLVATKQQPKHVTRIQAAPLAASSVRVRFQSERDADRVFKDLNRLIIPPRYMRHELHRRITVSRSYDYDGVLKHIEEATEIEIVAYSWALGHYFPQDDGRPDYVSDINRLIEQGRSQRSSSSSTRTEEWLEEVSIEEETPSSSAIKVRIDMVKRMITLEFSATDYAELRFKELSRPIEICQDCHSTSPQTRRYSLIVSWKHPPKLYSRALMSFGPIQLVDTGREASRNVSCASLPSSAFGDCFALKLEVEDTSLLGLFLNFNGLATLRSFGIVRQTVNTMEDATTITAKNIGTRTDQVAKAFEMLHREDRTVGFLLRAMLDQGKFCWYDALRDFVISSETASQFNVFGLLTSLVTTRFKDCVVEVLSHMARCSKPTRFPCNVIQSLIEYKDNDQSLPGYCVAIPRVLLTPTKYTVVGIEVETSNRVVREFIEKHGFTANNFLRVKIGDENGKRLYWNDFTSAVVSRVKSRILNGIVVNGSVYKFLAFSSSQLKECSLWMVSLEGKRWTVSEMRQSMGDFSKCGTPSKFAARMGQCFSTTFEGLDCNNSVRTANPGIRHAIIRDIASSVRNLVHSDGNGLIRRSTMTKLLKQLPSLRQNRELDHSIVQIRYGGAKGTLVAWEDSAFDCCLINSGCADPMQFDVALRESMVKFDAKFARLEVCRIGSMAPYYLNRNVALLLNSCHGVNASVFLEMQKKMLEDIDEMFTCSEAATSMISQLSGPDQEQRARLLNMLKCGLKVDVDPFLFSCCLAIRAHQLLGLRKKARVMVRKGAVVMGGLDVLKVLPEYCVFLQVRKLVPDGVASDMPELDEFEPIVGPVMVTKHPVMHPGDVRMLLAVDVPELRHHKNVILFSQLGGRPEADKMSGSDLDGDEFAVTWESRLFLGEWNKCSRDLSGHFVSGNGRVLHGSNIADDARILQIGNTEPMTYHDFTLPNSGSSLEVDDEGLMQHFLNFAKNDKLGPIGMLWQDWASKSGAGCDECLLLAHQHSVAVDFAKSGKPAEMPTETRWKGPRAHFREKKGDARSHYTCSSVVGMLYDQVKPSNELSTLQSFTVALAGRRLDRYGQVSSLLGDGDLGEVLVNNYNPSIPQRLGWLFDEKESTLAFQIPFEDIAEKEKKDYDYAVFQVMNKHELHNEGELATGCIRKFQALHKHRQHEVAEEVRRQGRQIYREGRTRFFRHVLNIVHATKVVCGLSSVLNSSVPDSPSGEESMVLAMQEMSISDGRQTSFEIVLDKGVLESSSSEHSKERLHWVESVATTERVVPPVLFSEEWIARLVARKLAAAYYLASYSPWRETGTKVLLFGFPWLVSDVIACGMSTTC